MTRESIISQLSRYFSVKELVCRHVYDRWGESAWQFLDTNYLHCLLIIRRDILKAGMTCNAGSNDERGLRCNLCDLVKSKTKPYISAHILGKAGDFTIDGISSREARDLIKESSMLFPCKIRLEGDVSWLHFDVLPQFGVKEKVYEFKG